jgi:cell division protein FtsL
MLSGAKKLVQGQLHVSPKDFWVVIAVSVLFMLGALALVWPNVKKIKLAYERQDLTQERRELLKENHLLNLERESLRSLDRIQLLAKSKVGMKEPDDGKLTTIFLK